MTRIVERYRVRIDEKGFPIRWVTLPSAASKTRSGLMVTPNKSDAYVCSRDQAEAIARRADRIFRASTLTSVEIVED